MEGNDCYKYKTVKEFLQRINQPKISTIIEIGVNYGHQTAEMLGYFPDARIVGFEPVPDICEQAQQRFRDRSNVVILPWAVTAEHIYTDDLGTQTHPHEMPLSLFLAQPEFGGGWEGSHRVRPPDYQIDPIKFKQTEIPIQPITLDEAVAFTSKGFNVNQIDFIKTDCEGSECSFLGCADPDTLKRVRFIAGEYHGIERFYKATETLRQTHYVNLIGGGYLGCFFAERKTEGNSLLCKERLPEKIYHHLCNTPLTWNVFDSNWINNKEYHIHGIENKTMACNCNRNRVTPRMRKHMPLNTETSAQLVADHLTNIAMQSPRTYTGRGIITCGGGLKYIPGLWVLIRMLREVHNCQLPIQIWQLGDKETDFEFEKLCKPYGVEFVDALTLDAAKDHPRLNGWELKSFAAINSPYKEILLIDADNVPAQNPEYLFESDEFKSTGCIAWPDFGRLAESRSAWQISGNTYRSEPEWETGQLMMDKQKCWRALCLADWFNRNSNFYFEHWHGDKESFHLAFNRTQTPYTMISKPIRGIEATMIQHDLKGNELFFHRNMGKFSLTDNKNVSGFYRESTCLQWIDELRNNWGDIPELGDVDKEAMKAIQLRKYDYIRINHDARELELLPGGRIGKGQASLENHWHIKDGKLYLVSDTGSITAVLQPATDNDWAGRWIVHEKMPIYLNCTYAPTVSVQ